MKIDSKMITHLASLSAVELNEKEVEDMKKDFEKILDLVDEIEKSEISEVYKENNIVPLSDLREDNDKTWFSQEEVLANAPKQRRGYFVVPKVVE